MEEITAKVESFLKSMFGGFESFPGKNKEYSFYKNYGEPNLTILILITYPKEKPLIRSCIKVTRGRYCFWTRDTLVKKGWKEVLGEKIGSLDWIIKGDVICPKCNVWKIPLVRKNHKTGTNFVAYYCPICDERTNTPYGIGIKTDMHSLLRRKKSVNLKRKNPEQKIPQRITTQSAFEFSLK